MRQVGDVQYAGCTLLLAAGIPPFPCDSEKDELKKMDKWMPVLPDKTDS